MPENAIFFNIVIFMDVALCRSWVNRCFRGTYRLHLQGRKLRERGTSVSRWLQTEPPVGNNQLYIRTGRERKSRPYGKSTERRGVRSVVKVKPAGEVYKRQGIDKGWGKTPGILSEH
jgi:hypothetical protein